jgi:hypothetical protein
MRQGFDGSSSLSWADGQHRWSRETPLRLMLAARLPELLPDPSRYSTWGVFIRDTLEARLRQLRRDYRVSALEQLPWAISIRLPSDTLWSGGCRPWGGC